MRKTLLFLFLGCLLIPGWQAFAQDKQVSGVVTADDGSVLLVMVTHEGPERSVAAALEKLEGSPSLLGPPMLMHILAN